MKQNNKSILILVTLIIILLMYLLNSEYIINNFINYSLLFLKKLFPTSFLFFIISSLLLDYGIIEFLEKVRKKSSCSFYLLLISLISGFPSGAKYTKDLYQKNYIDIQEANNYLLFSHFPNPLFIIGVVSKIIESKETSIKLLLSIILSNLLIYFFTSKSKEKNPPRLQTNSDFSTSLAKATKDSLNTLTIIYGTSIFFYLIASIILKQLTLSPTNYVLVNGFFDLTKGIFSTSLISNVSLRVFFLILFISFGSLSIHMQVKSIIANTPLKYKYFLRGRIISFIITLIIYTIISSI